MMIKKRSQPFLSMSSKSVVIVKALLQEGEAIRARGVFFVHLLVGKIGIPAMKEPSFLASNCNTAMTCCVSGEGDQ